MTDMNARSTIGAARTLPAIHGAGTLIADGPTTRLDRTDWAPIEFRVPVDGTVHAPIWRTRAAFGDTPARQHGLFPTAETALDLGGHCGEQIGAGFVEPVRAVVDLAALPVRMFIEPVWSPVQSPSLYKRWHSGEWLAGPIPEPGEGEP